MYRFHRYLESDNEGKQHRESVHGSIDGAVKAAMYFLMLEEFFYPEEKNSGRDYEEYYMDFPAWLPKNWCEDSHYGCLVFKSLPEIAQVIRAEIEKEGQYKLTGHRRSWFTITPVGIAMFPEA